MPNLTLEGHEKGVNCIDYYSGADKPYIVSGSDDQTVKIWDYQTRNCVQTLNFHQHNVECVSFLGDRPLILSGSEDGTVVLWNSSTYRNETVLSYNLERCWSSVYSKSLNRIALGFDLGTSSKKVYIFGRKVSTGDWFSTGARTKAIRHSSACRRMKIYKLHRVQSFPVPAVAMGKFCVRCW